MSVAIFISVRIEDIQFLSQASYSGVLRDLKVITRSAARHECDVLLDRLELGQPLSSSLRAAVQKAVGSESPYYVERISKQSPLVFEVSVAAIVELVIAATFLHTLKKAWSKSPSHKFLMDVFTTNLLNLVRKVPRDRRQVCLGLLRSYVVNDRVEVLGELLIAELTRRRWLGTFEITSIETDTSRSDCDLAVTVSASPNVRRMSSPKIDGEFVLSEISRWEAS